MIRELLVSMRPHQWTKNLLLFAGLVFSRNLLQVDLTVRVLGAFVAFCALSGAVYLVNDVVDAARDREHPQKRHRPVAAGRLAPGAALGAALGLGAAAGVGAFGLGWRFGLVAVAYLGLLVAYSVWLKHVVIVEALVIALGFVLRALAGAVVIAVEFSPWLLLCTILLALFLTFGKRRHELLALEAGAEEHRPSLLEYSPQFLDQMIAVVTAATLMAYALYTVSADTAARLGTPYLPLTIPLVLYGLFRYLYLLYRRELGGNPAEHLLSDPGLLGAVGTWGLLVVGLVYLAR